MILKRKFNDTIYDCVECFMISHKEYDGKPDLNFLKNCKCDHLPKYIPREQMTRYMMIKVVKLESKDVKKAFSYYEPKIFDGTKKDLCELLEKKG